MPDHLCATCGVRPEALAGVRLCRPCLEVGETVLRQLRAAEPTSVPAHITPAFLRAWAVTAAADVRFLSPVCHILRGVVQGVLLAEEQVIDSQNFGSVVYVSLAAMQALQEARG